MLIKPLWPVAEYVINYDYISNILCENKDKPNLNCNGKCYLVKQLSKENSNSNDNPFNEQLKAEILNIIFFQSLTNFSFGIVNENHLKNNFRNPKTLIVGSYIAESLQPPEFY